MAWKGERDGPVACGRCERTPPAPARPTWAPVAPWPLRPRLRPLGRGARARGMHAKGGAAL